MKNVQKNNIALLIVDVQEKLMNKIENRVTVLQNICTLVKGFQILEIPIFVTEQYPKGLGPTSKEIREVLAKEQKYFSKTTFSCLKNEEIFDEITKCPKEHFVVVGIETHVCILQTVKDLLPNKQVIVLQDATSCRKNVDYCSAIDEIRQAGARISTLETILFEILCNSKAEEFKKISDLIK